MAKPTPREISPIGIKIKQALKLKGMTQKDLAKATFFSYPTIESWITGRSSPRLIDIQTVAKTLDVSIAWLMDDEGAVCRLEELQDYAKKALYWYMRKHKMPAEWYGTVDEFIEHDFRNYVEE